MRFSSVLLLTIGLGADRLLAQNAQSFVDLPVPTIDSHPPQTEEQTARASAVGRFPGPLEVLQPSIDTTLSSYQVSTQNLKGNYTFAASDVLAVLTQRWADAFMSLYPNVTIRIPGPYAGSLGALELINGTLEGVFVSRELKPSDISSFQKKFGYPPFSVPISQGSYRQYGFLDTMAFVVHKDNPVETLSFTQLDSILSTTRARGGKAIRTWGEVGVTGSLANETIQVYGLAPWNGIEEFIRERVLSYNGTRGQWRNGNASDPSHDKAVHWDQTIFNATRHVYEDPAGISYTGLAYIDRPCKIIATYNNTGDTPVSPTYENVATESYPLARFVYFNTNKPANGTYDPVLSELTKFVLSREGQQILLDQGIFLPFRSGQQSKSLGMLK